MNSARPLPLPYQPTEDRMAEYDRMARRARELDRRERALLTAWARIGTAEVHSPFLGRVHWNFGRDGLVVNEDTTPQGDHI
jgi:hypothetical protein